MVTFPLPLPEARVGHFSCLYPENLARLLEVKLRLGLQEFLALRLALLKLRSTSCSFRQQLLLLVTCDSLYPPGCFSSLGGPIVVCPVTSILCKTQEKLLIFSLFRSFPCSEDRSYDFQHLYVLDGNQKLHVSFGYHKYLFLSCFNCP